ncbi:elongation factor Ts [Chloroflexota bacterium]
MSLQISTDQVKELRAQSGSGVMDCRNALIETEGNIDKALDILRERSLVKAQKKSERSANQGVIEAYIHTGRNIGAMVEVNCESDFVALTDEFKELAHDLAMQVAATGPQFISEEEIPDDTTDVNPEQDCLLKQPFIKSPEKTIQEIINEAVAKMGENIKVNRISRFELGD